MPGLGLASRAQSVLARARRASTANQGDAEDWTTGGRLPGGHPVNEELGCPCPSHVTAEPRPWGLLSSCFYRHRTLRHGCSDLLSCARRRGRAGPRDAMAAILEWRISDPTRLMAVPVYDRRCLGTARCLIMTIAPSTRQLATPPSSDFSFVLLLHG